MKAQLIVALDLPSPDLIAPTISLMPDTICHYKIGLELFTSAGPAALQQLKDARKKIFLDLKLHDIPRTVTRSVTSAAQHDVSLLTVHASGGRDMLSAAADAAGELGDKAPLIIAVTTLTSLDNNDLKELGVSRTTTSHTLALAELALSCGIDGLVCSPLEVAEMRKNFGTDPALVVPGIRPSGFAAGDQKRTATPTSAVRDGASFLVVGRPILKAGDPAHAAQMILDEMNLQA